MSKLFSPLKIKSVEFKNRIWVSPMCQYSSVDGHPTDWHFVHLGSRAVGGAGLVVVEATAVSPEGRISPEDSGIWSDDHIASFQRLTQFIKTQGAVPGIQIAHAGRKASTFSPWKGSGSVPLADGGWETIAPSAVAFDKYAEPREMNESDFKKVIGDFEKAAERSSKAGFEVLEIHLAHGYLLNEFLTPISNKRKDMYGGSLENRMRFPLEVARAVRAKWPQHLPLFARISATDWADEDTPSFTENDAVVLSQKLKEFGVDLIDCSTGGSLSHPSIPVGPNYQVPFAQKIRKEAEVMTSAVGMITEPHQAEEILSEGKADAIFMAREMLRDPYWPLHAATALGDKVKKPVQYGRS